MNQSSIYKKIGKVMQKIERIPKNGFNEYHKYHYVTEADLMDKIRPLLAETGLAFYSSVLEQQKDKELTKVKMEFVLADADTGECIKSIYWGEAHDKGDKGLYKAYTGATKYFLMKTFLIATGDDPERSQDGFEEGTKERNSQKKTATKNKTEQPKQPKTMTDEQSLRMYTLVNDLTGGNAESEMILQQVIQQKVEGFKGFDDSEMPYEVADKVIQYLKAYKSKREAKKKAKEKAAQ